ncbi:MAG: hypothetical protein HY753_00040 [Nitrospirae bacterium]|nr:hypothetical protein [Nitrospirota bacterium]
MENMTAVIERANEVMGSEGGINNIKLPALREVMQEVTSSKAGIYYGYRRHSDHSKTSTKGCVMGCVGG